MIKTIFIFAFAIIIFSIIQPVVVEGWYDWVSGVWNKVKLTGTGVKLNLTDKIESKPERYYPQCLTDKPYGYPDLTCQYWKGLERSYAQLHQDSNFQGQNAKPVASDSLSDIGNPSGANVNNISIRSRELDHNYYPDAQKYCLDNPNKYPCPNHWIINNPDKDKRFTHFKSNPENALKQLPQVKGYFPKRDNLLKYEALNRAMTVIAPEREFLALC